MAILAFDPGGTTGWAWFREDHESGLYRLYLHGTFPTWDGAEKVIVDAHLHEKTLEVVYEDIKVFNPAFNPVGRDVIGVIEFLCKKLTIQVSKQSPGMIKGLTARFKHELMVFPTQHERDAIAHGTMFLGVDRVDPTLWRSLV